MSSEVDVLIFMNEHMVGKLVSLAQLLCNHRNKHAVKEISFPVFAVLFI